MAVVKIVRSEVAVIPVKHGEGEYLQYLVSTASENPNFRLNDAETREVILSERELPSTRNPATFTREWPVIGDRPQPRSSLVLSLTFGTTNQLYTFQVRHRRMDGSWQAAIDIDFRSSTPGELYLYTFTVLAE